MKTLALFLLTALTGLALLSIYLLEPPAPIPASAPATDFSAERAMQHVRQIAREPHAMGTAAHARVRQYLLAEMQALGLDPQVQEASAVNSGGAAASVGYVYNLVGRLKGKGNAEKALLLMAHYDSQPNARGAGDDGAGVAAILETVRALKRAEPLDHDVMVLLSDGEEYGLYGARAFLKHRWAKDVALVLNLEARGNQGPSMTFELSPGNGWLARQYIEAAPYPYINSLAYEIYSRMPNDTDFTVFKEAGYSGLNSAFIDGFVHYHKLTDAPENLSLSSLQHHGSNLLALTRHFGKSTLTQTKAPDRVFFNFINGWVISYPMGLNLLWVVLAALLLACVVGLAVRRQVVTGRQVALGFLLYLVLLVLVVALFVPLNRGVLSLLPYTQPFNGLYGADNFFMAYLLLALGLFMLLSWLVLRWLRLFALWLGVLVLHFLLASVLWLLVPGGAFLLLFPLLFSLAGVLVLLMMGLQQAEDIGPKHAVVLLLAAVPAIFMLLPIAEVVFTAFSLQMPLGTIALLMLLLGMLLPLLQVITRSFNWRGLPLLSLALLLAGGLQVFRAVGGEKPSPERPLHSHVSYFLDADARKAYWVSAARHTDVWNEQFFPAPSQGPLTEIYPHASKRYLKNRAQVAEVPAPVAQVLQDSLAGDARHLHLRLSSPRGAAHLEIMLLPQAPAAVLGVALAGEELGLEPLPAGHAGKQSLYFARLHGLPASKEVDLTLRLKPGAPLMLYLTDQSIGLPQQLVKRPKPAYVVAEQGRDSNLTVVRKQYSF